MLTILDYFDASLNMGRVEYVKALVESGKVQGSYIRAYHRSLVGLLRTWRETDLSPRYRDIERYLRGVIET